MEESIFDPAAQIGRTDFKIVVALERLSEAFRVLLWHETKTLNLSPLQIQMLVYIQFHPGRHCKVSHLARTFNLSKPTVSEAVKTLEQKGLLERQPEPLDFRSHSLHLTRQGKQIATHSAHFADPMARALTSVPPEDKGVLLKQLLNIIAQLRQADIISVQRMCFFCRFYEKTPDGGQFCRFLKQPLTNAGLRVDCEEFQEQPAEGWLKE